MSHTTVTVHVFWLRGALLKYIYLNKLLVQLSDLLKLLVLHHPSLLQDFLLLSEEILQPTFLKGYLPSQQPLF